MRIRASVLGGFLVSSLALADAQTYLKTTKAECGAVDLIASAPKAIQDYYRSFNRQGDLNWCYAYSAADLLSWEYKMPASAAYVAIKNNDNLNVFSRGMRKVGKALFGMNAIVPEYGNSEDGIKLGLKNGICPLEVLPSDNPSIVKINDEITRLRKVATASSAMESEGCPNLSELTKLYPSQSLKDIMEAVADVHDADVQETLNKLANKACHKKLLVSASRKSLITLQSSQENLVDAVNEHFSDEKPSPISLVINPQVFNNPEKAALSSLMTHAVTLLARRYDEKSGTCKYLVRDSNGDSACSHYAKGLECKDSHYWITDDMLHRGAWNITYVKQ